MIVHVVCVFEITLGIYRNTVEGSPPGKRIYIYKGSPLSKNDFK